MVTQLITLALLVLQCGHIRVNCIEDVCHCILKIKALGCRTEVLLGRGMLKGHHHAIVASQSHYSSITSNLILFYNTCVRSVIDYAVKVCYNALPQYLINEFNHIENSLKA